MKNIFINLVLGSSLFLAGSQSNSESSACSNLTGISLPFDYVEEESVLWLEAADGSSEKLRLSLGPFGAHVPMFTGHYVGNSKQDLQAHYAASWAEMNVLEDDNVNGVCDAGEVCGIPQAQLLERAPVYRVPDK
jgi:hypothetical protein